MIIEITGAGFNNKGAELMLAAIVDRLSHSMPDAKLVIDPRMGPYELRARYGLLQKFDATNSGRLGWLRERLFHDGYQQRYGLVPERRVDAILDASGYAFGDIMAESHVHAKAATFLRWQSQGKKIVLLPQAFGPFERASTRSAFNQILDSADLVYMRDEESYQHIVNLVPEHHGLRRASDFTNLAGTVSSAEQLYNKKCAAIIPSIRAILNGPNECRHSYVSFFAASINALKATDIEPIFLPHEAPDDIGLCDEIRRAADCSVEILHVRDPLRLKRAVGGCWVTVSSRYHGLVNALSQGVPSIGTSWTHKYLGLFSDYERPNWLVDYSKKPEDAIEELRTIIQRRESERIHLLNCSARLNIETKNLWGEVEEFLETARE